MLCVEFYGLDQDGSPVKEGHLLWDGSKFRGSPAGSKLIHSILVDPIRVHTHPEGEQVGEVEIIRASDNPESFMAFLHRFYHSPYLQATKPKKYGPGEFKEAGFITPDLGDLGIWGEQPKGGWGDLPKVGGGLRPRGGSSDVLQSDLHPEPPPSMNTSAMKRKLARVKANLDNKNKPPGSPEPVSAIPVSSGPGSNVVGVQKGKEGPFAGKHIPSFGSDYGWDEIEEEINKRQPGGYSPEEMEAIKAKHIAKRAARGLGPNSEPNQTPMGPVDKDTLRAGQVKTKKRVGGAHLNETYKIGLDNGHFVAFKPESGEETGVRNTIPDFTGHNREIAASDVADAIGLDDLVPATVRFEHPEHGTGSAQHWKKGEGAAQLWGAEKFDGPDDLARAAAFDYLIGNTDRHFGNWLVETGGKANGEDQMHLIDNGLSFPTDTGEWYGNTALTRRARMTKARIPPEVQDWDWDKIEKAMTDNDIEQGAIDMAKERLRELQNTSHFHALATYNELDRRFAEKGGKS